MSKLLKRPVDLPIREHVTYSERWEGSDRGLIWCWENGRLRSAAEPSLAARARDGELVPLGWKRGSLQYLAQWQGLRNENLAVPLDDECRIVCAKTKKQVVFKPGVVPEDEKE